MSGRLTGSALPIRTTWCPRRASSSLSRATNSLTGFRVARRCGETWAIVSGWGEGTLAKE